MIPAVDADEPAGSARGGAAFPRAIGRYWIYGEIAAGGMATVHLGRLMGPGGFTRTVAIKRLHPQFAKDDEFSAMFLDEARVAARIRHPNALTALDVVAVDGELYIVMDYIHGESLQKLLRGGPMPPGVTSGIMSQALLGLHAAHEAVDDRGQPLRIVHRDVSPQNILVGVDGVARVVDFGIAKAASSAHTTQAGQIKGKLAYMSPQQVSGGDVDRRADIFAAGVVLWEAATGRRLLARGEATVLRVVDWNGIQAEDLHLAPPSLHGILERALAREPGDRFANAREMAMAIASAIPVASSLEIGDWLEQRAGETLASRALAVANVERQTTIPQARPVGTADFRASSGEDTRTALTSKSLEEGLVNHSSRTRTAAIVVLLALSLTLTVFALTRPSGGDAPSRSANPPPARVERTEVSHADGSPAASTPQTPVLAPSSLPLAEPAASQRSTLPKAAPKSSPRGPRLISKKSNCDPSFEIGADGIKHFKPECFQ